MKTSKYNRSIPLTLAFLFLAALAPVRVSAQAFVELANGQRVPVERILARPDGSLVVFRDGQPTELQRNMYIRAVGVRPETLDQANRMLARGDRDGAIPLLEQIISSSAYQTWDVVAGISLANAHIDSHNPSSAQRILNQLKTRYGDRATEIFPQLQQLEWRTRIANRQTDGLEEELTTIIRANDNRAKAASALITRGDLKHQRAELRPAVLDYMRAVLFHRDQPELHAQALFRAASTFNELGETANGRKYMNELRERHPNSEYAARASSAN